MPTLPPDSKPFAFKEWQVVCDALESGEQAVILRKGGISEGKLGFQWLHEHFFLFPTFFHEQVQQVLPDPGSGLPRDFRPPRSGGDEIEIRLFAETLDTRRLTDWDEIAALAPEHIWTEPVIRERFEWGDEPGITLARLRVWKLPRPWVLADRKGFGGCRSWIGLPADEGMPDLADATPIEPAAAD